jgi:hypothetical protein
MACKPFISLGFVEKLSKKCLKVLGIPKYSSNMDLSREQYGFFWPEEQ